MNMQQILKLLKNSRVYRKKMSSIIQIQILPSRSYTHDLLRNKLVFLLMFSILVNVALPSYIQNFQ